MNSSIFENLFLNNLMEIYLILSFILKLFVPVLFTNVRYFSLVSKVINDRRRKLCPISMPVQPMLLL